jgi:hypothetical protein
MALAAAYVIALASLVSSLAAARAAAETVAHPPGSLCHSETVEGADVPAQRRNGCSFSKPKPRSATYLT